MDSTGWWMEPRVLQLWSESERARFALVRIIITHMNSNHIALPTQFKNYHRPLKGDRYQSESLLCMITLRVPVYADFADNSIDNFR